MPGQFRPSRSHRRRPARERNWRDDRGRARWRCGHRAPACVRSGAFICAARFWVRVYTSVVGCRLREERRATLETEFYEEARQLREEGYQPHSIGLRIFGRCLLGAHHDIAWMLGNIHFRSRLRVVYVKAIVRLAQGVLWSTTVLDPIAEKQRVRFAKMPRPRGRLRWVRTQRDIGAIALHTMMLRTGVCLGRGLMRHIVPQLEAMAQCPNCGRCRMCGGRSASPEPPSAD